MRWVYESDASALYESLNGKETYDVSCWVVECMDVDVLTRSSETTFHITSTIQTESLSLLVAERVLLHKSLTIIVRLRWERCRMRQERSMLC